MSDKHFLDALDLSDDAKAALRNIKDEMELAYLDEFAHLRAENKRLREGGRPWNIDRKDVATHVDDEGERKHLVAACFDADHESDKTAYYKGILLVHCARYIQWLEDELWRYQGVPDELHDDWDETKVRGLAEGDPSKTHPTTRDWMEDIQAALATTLEVLDANRMWRVGAERETSRLGNWNLNLRGAIKHVVGTNDGRPLGVTAIKLFQAALVDKPAYEDTNHAKVVEALKRLNQVLNEIRGEDGAKHATLLQIDSLVESCLPLLADIEQSK